jgi:hypothetical protein
MSTPPARVPSLQVKPRTPQRSRMLAMSTVSAACVFDSDGNPVHFHLVVPHCLLSFPCAII